MGSPMIIGPDGSIADADLATVSKQVDPYIPAAQPLVTRQMVADAIVGDQIIVLVVAAASPEAGLGDVSPVRASGVAVRIRYADLTNCPPPPVDVRLGRPQGGDHG